MHWNDFKREQTILQLQNIVQKFYRPFISIYRFRYVDCKNPIIENAVFRKSFTFIKASRLQNLQTKLILQLSVSSSIEISKHV